MKRPMHIIACLATVIALTGCTHQRQVLCITASGDFKPETGAELLDAFNSQMPFSVSPRQFICNAKNGKLVGWVVVKTEKHKVFAKETLRRSPRLDCIQVEALTPEMASEIKSNWRESQNKTVSGSTHGEH